MKAMPARTLRLTKYKTLCPHFASGLGCDSVKILGHSSSSLALASSSGASLSLAESLLGSLLLDALIAVAARDQINAQGYGDNSSRGSSKYHCSIASGEATPEKSRTPHVLQHISFSNTPNPNWAASIRPSVAVARSFPLILRRHYARF